MRTLEILVKRATRQMEDLAVAASETLARRNDVLARRAAAEAAIHAEASLIGSSPLSGMGFAEYLDRQKQRITELDAEYEIAEAEHETAKAALVKIFAERKKLEILLERQNERIQLERDQIEQAMFDERSAQTFNR